MEDVDFFACGSLSPNSQHTYDSCWRDFKAFCMEQRLCPLPTEMETIARYYENRSTKRSTGSLETAVAAICRAHNIRKHELPPKTPRGKIAQYILDLKHPAYANIRTAIRREKGTRPVKKAALTWPMLLEIIPQLGDSFHDRRTKALLLTGFGTAARRSEI